MTDENWEETRFLAQNVAKFLNKDPKEVEEILRTCEDFLVHRFLEMYLEDEDHTGKDYAIELPYLGTLVVSFNTKVSCTYSFTPRKQFIKKLKRAYNQEESPLVEQLTKKLGDKLVTEYKIEKGEF